MTKYMPGKIWVVIGRAGYISHKYGIDIIKTSYVSFIENLTSITSVLVFSIIGMIKLDLNGNYLLVSIVFFIITIFFLLYQDDLIPLIKHIPLLNRLSLKPQRFNKIVLYKAITYFFFYWLIIAFSFYFLSLSLLENPPSHDALFFLYPISTIIGMIIFIAPGGVGVREGALVMLLSTFNFKLSDIIMLAINSRVLFIICELLIFSSSLLIKRKTVQNFY